MKCTSCYMLNVEGDTRCFRCGGELGSTAGSGGGGASWAAPGSTGTPGWAYVFAVICGAIPVLALGGCIPIFIGFSGASSCLSIARATSVPVVLRVLACIAISTGCWILFAALIVAVADLQAES